MNYIQIGFTKKTHGIGGEVKVVIKEQFEDLFLDADRVFLEMKGSKQPFFIKQVRGGGDLIVQFEDVANREEALPIQSRGIFLPENEVPEEALVVPDNGLLYGHLVGYLLVDQALGEIGPVIQVLDMPQQEISVVDYQGREVLVPLNPHFVLSVDDAARRVLVNLPDGLLEL
ncbi:MAG: 16S rRNA processing protein RimM [Lewinellaceae bacterium]|nr:16S rRNA processing protein RimM [Lewinellaceae bacterium]